PRRRPRGPHRCGPGTARRGGHASRHRFRPRHRDRGSGRDLREVPQRAAVGGGRSGRGHGARASVLQAGRRTHGRPDRAHQPPGRDGLRGHPARRRSRRFLTNGPMDATDARHLLGFGVALGCGLLIGIERERRKGRGPARALAGVRTFTLAALCGSVAQSLGQPLLVAAGGALVLLLAVIGYLRERRRPALTADPGVTTEIALFVTFLLGVTAVDRPALAAGAAVVVALLLAARSPPARVAPGRLAA